MKKCKLCEENDFNYLFTSFDSKNKANIVMLGNALMIHGDDYGPYRITCNYCPVCGRKLQDENNDIISE